MVVILMKHEKKNEKEKEIVMMFQFIYGITRLDKYALQLTNFKLVTCLLIYISRTFFPLI